MSFLSTGQASKLLSVTPDTVLKWIKQGRLPAFRTAGGHYRISMENINSLTGNAELTALDDVSYPPEENLLYCWEFFRDNNKTRKGCHDCLAYRAQALKCYEMNHLSEEMGRNGDGKSGCDDCSYFRYLQGRPYNILVITDDQNCRELLINERGEEKIIFQFATCEYECALIIDRFRPDFVLLDCTMEEDKCRELCHHLANDPRILGSTIILATPARRLLISFPGTIRLKHPFSLKDIEKFLKTNQTCRSIRFDHNHQ